MADHSKLSQAAEDRRRAWPSFDWFVPILWGVGIGVFIGIVTFAVIVFNEKSYIPNWVFGWISNDREIQKHQFRLALSGLLGIWVATRFIKHGVFGEFVRTSYNDLLLKLKFGQSATEEEDHTRVCPLKNVRIAASLAGFFALQAFQSWRALGKPLLESSLYDLLFRIVLLSIFFPVLLRMARCVPERFILGIVTIRIVTGWVFEYGPGLVDPVAGLVRQVNCLLWILALITSLGLVVSSLSTPKLLE